jgi:hypothetical protein
MSVLVMGAALPAAAQDDVQPFHQGFHATIGGGFASSGSQCGTCGGESRVSALSFTLRVGGALTKNVVLSAEYDAQSQPGDLTAARIASVALVAQWYPRVSDGFFVMGGGGFAVRSVSTAIDPAGDMGMETSIGPAFLGGVGYDVHLLRGLSVTPYAHYLWAAQANASVAGGSLYSPGKVGANMINAGVALSWR